MKTFLGIFFGLLLASSSTRAGVQYSVIADTTTNDAEIARGSWFFSTGYFYGTSQFSMGNLTGTVWRYDLANAQFEVLHTFAGGAGGSQPQGLVEGSNGFLYGVAYEGNNSLGTLFRIDRTGASFSTLHHFTALSGGDPARTPIEATDHKLYGIAGEGGAFSRGGIYRINLDGSGYSLQRAFSGTAGLAPGDGSFSGGIIEGPDGLLYGSTKTGGSSDEGVVFSIEKDGDPYTVLRHFPSTGLRRPMSRLLVGSDGFLYGITEQGGLANQGGIFRIATDGSGYRVLHEFRSDEGYLGNMALVEGVDGYLYGTLFYSPNNNGIVFRLPKTGGGFAVLHRFQSTPDGAQPDAHLIERSPRTFFGTTSSGGANSSGCIFRLIATLQAPTVKVNGPKIQKFRGRRLVLRGTAKDELGLQRVEYSSGKAYRTATGIVQWSARIPVKRTTKSVTVRLRAVDNDALVSGVATVRARRAS